MHCSGRLASSAASSSAIDSGASVLDAAAVLKTTGQASGNRCAELPRGSAERKEIVITLIE